jgi:hypothetical protein
MPSFQPERFATLSSLPLKRFPLRSLRPWRQSSEDRYSSEIRQWFALSYKARRPRRSPNPHYRANRFEPLKRLSSSHQFPIRPSHRAQPLGRSTYFFQPSPHQEREHCHRLMSPPRIPIRGRAPIDRQYSHRKAHFDSILSEIRDFASARTLAVFGSRSAGRVRDAGAGREVLFQNKLHVEQRPNQKPPIYCSGKVLAYELVNGPIV